MPKILCVEDNPVNMELVRRTLTRRGYEVIEATSGQTGIAMALKEKPNLILMDINLPDINGIEAATRIKSFEGLANTPIIALTAYAQHGDRERFLRAGFDDYIPKPIAKTELRNTITFFLAQSAR